MAQHKYDLLLVSTNPDKVVRQQPWYKERLKTKYIKQRKKSDTSPSLIGRNWILVKSGMDDFRHGVPLNFDDQYVIEGAKGISPVVKENKNSFASRLKKDKARNPTLNKSQVCMDKLLPAQRRRRDYIDEIEYGLTQHPLALYPHLEEGMSPELFEEIVDLLDPAMNPDTESEMDRAETNTEQNVSSDQIVGAEVPVAQSQQEAAEDKKRPEEAKTRNPYKWILRKNDDQKDDKKGFKKRPTSPSQDEHIKKVTKDFCDWVTNLGGDSNNVEESTIMSLFASGYETKPALSVPIHVVELSNVPAELRMSAGISPPGSARKSFLSTVPTQASGTDVPSGYQPSWVKIKYGAWYLEPESWKVRSENEPLEDPDEIAKREMSESKQKSAEMDAQLAPLHGAKAFRDFLERSGKRKPEFMGRVSRLQDEEAAKTEVLQQKLNRSNPSRGSQAKTRSSVGIETFSPI